MTKKLYMSLLILNIPVGTKLDMDTYDTEG